MSKVLLINDCKFESMVMKDIIDSLGYDVEIVSEYEALDKIKYLYPDTIIVNLIMKTTTGDKLIEKIKDLREDVRCILSSSNSIKLSDFKYKKVDEIIHTPVNRMELAKVLECKVAKKSRDASNSEMEELLQKLKKKTSLENNFSFCPYCGNKLNEGFQFCPKCGHKL